MSETPETAEAIADEIVTLFFIDRLFDECRDWLEKKIARAIRAERSAADARVAKAQEEMRERAVRVAGDIADGARTTDLVFGTLTAEFLRGHGRACRDIDLRLRALSLADPAT